MARWGGRAVVAGGSIAGLLAARVLADHFDEVVIVERDPVEAKAPDVAPRKGVPQGRHVHGLLPHGTAVIERLFPGIVQELLAAGAVSAEMGSDLRWFHFGGYKRPFRSGLVGISQSRPLLEAVIRRRCAGIGTLRHRTGWQVEGLLAGADRRAIAGVALRPVGGGTAEPLEADLVVDATGRGSRAAAWLSALGWQAPRESAVRVDVTYTTRLYRRAPDDLERAGARLLFVLPHPPAERCLGAAFAIEGDRWIVMLGGWLGAQAPAEEIGFLAYARSLPAPDLYELIHRAEPVSDFAIHRFPSSRRRHYEALPRPPAGFLAVGDAMCSFNPIYGQGMTVAALQADALQRTMAALGEGGRSPEALPRAFFRAAGRIVDVAWAQSVGEDFRFPEVTGPRPAGLWLLNWYGGRLHEAATMDVEVHRAFLGVMNLTQPPATVFRPGIAWRVLRHRVPGRVQT